jgi:hypothetical protein
MGPVRHIGVLGLICDYNCHGNGDFLMMVGMETVSGMRMLED